MNYTVIPAPVRFEVGGKDGFAFQPGTAVVYAGGDIAPIVERFCSEIMRRTGLRLAAEAGLHVSDEPFVMVELVGRDYFGALPEPSGLSPTGALADERHSLVIEDDLIVVRAVEPVGVARGLTTLVQLLAAAPPVGPGKFSVPAAQILDAPRYAWRGLSLDLARTFFTVPEIRRVIDLLEMYKLNVLHMHLTDDQSWRLPTAVTASGPDLGAAVYSEQDLRALVGYAADRFVTLVPEVDTPGHAYALMQLYPALVTGHNVLESDTLLGRKHRTAWLDPDSPATFEVISQVLAGVTAIFPGLYLHIGADEPHGMPRDLYTSYVQRTRRLVRSLGKRPLGWQESARAGLNPDDVIQYWFTGTALPALLPPQARAQIDANLATSRRDVETALAASVPIIMSPLSHCYLDVPYAEQPSDAAQVDRQNRVGLRLYSPRTVADSFDWEPAQLLGPGGDARVAGVEAAIWAETISGFDDLSFLLLPRLAGVAHRAWSAQQPAGWNEHRERLARHARMWAQDSLTYFRTSTVGWSFK